MAETITIGQFETPKPEDTFAGEGCDAPVIKTARNQIGRILYEKRGKGTDLGPVKRAHDDVTTLLMATFAGHFKLMKDAAGILGYLYIPKALATKGIKRVIRVDEHNHEYIEFMHKYFGIFAGNPVFKYATKQIGAHTVASDEAHKIHELCQYDPKTGTLWMCFGDFVLKITPDGRWTFQENGDDDRFFILHRDASKIDLEELRAAAEATKVTSGLSIEPSSLIDYLFKGVPFEEGTSLTPEMCERLILSGFLALPFNLGEKPIFYFLGDHDTGKTHLLRKMAYVTYGTKYDVTSVGDDEKDFSNTLLNNYFLLLDDTQDDSRNNAKNAKRLTQCATGGKMRMRTYYTNREEMDVPFISWVWLSGLVAFDKAGDFMSRVVPINFRGTLPGERQSKDDLKAYVEANRVKLLAEYLLRLTKVVEGRWLNRDKKYKCHHRMSDWERLAYRTAELEGAIPEWEETFKTLVGTSAVETTASDGLVTVISIWLSNKSNNGREVDKETFFRELKHIAKNREIYVLSLAEHADYNYFTTCLGKIRKTHLVPQFHYVDRDSESGGRRHKVVKMTLSEEQFQVNKERAYSYLGFGPDDVESKEAGDKVAARLRRGTSCDLDAMEVDV